MEQNESPVSESLIKPKRKRIEKIVATPAIFDPLEFTNNKCSKNARKIGNTVESIHIDYWIDKHYHIRDQQGDDNGKREGIEQEKVHLLLCEAVKHLMFYSGTVKNFTFLNYNTKPVDGRKIRVVCQKVYESNKLNVVIEAHVAGLNLFEITVITAIQKNEYVLSDGQYAIEILGASNSELIYNSRGKVELIASI